MNCEANEPNLLLTCIELKLSIQIAKETGIDLTEECEPLKNYEGNNVFLLDLKREAKEAGFI